MIIIEAWRCAPVADNGHRWPCPLYEGRGACECVTEGGKAA